MILSEERNSRYSKKERKTSNPLNERGETKVESQFGMIEIGITVLVVAIGYAVYENKLKKKGY